MEQVSNYLTDLEIKHNCSRTHYVTRKLLIILKLPVLIYLFQSMTSLLFKWMAMVNELSTNHGSLVQVVLFRVTVARHSHPLCPATLPFWSTVSQLLYT